MIKTISSKNMGKSDLGWLRSTFHFSFADYYNNNNMQFGALRVINDDTIAAKTGFDTHPHKDMEIITYVVRGAITHRDSMGNQGEIARGQVQYMSAGTGVYHSEHNLSDSELRLLQIWILPDKNNHTPQYGDFKFSWEDREGKWLKIVTGQKGNAPILIHQDAEISVISISAGQEQYYTLKQGRKAYLVQIEGTGTVNKNTLEEKDAAEITDEGIITLAAVTNSHYILFDLA